MQTANWTAFFCCRFILSVQVAFTFDFLLANSVRFVPVQFSQPDSPSNQPYFRDPFQFSPSAPTILFAKSLQVTDGVSARNRLDISDLADDFKAHCRLLKRG